MERISWSSLTTGVTSLSTRPIAWGFTASHTIRLLGWPLAQFRRGWALASIRRPNLQWVESSDQCMVALFPTNLLLLPACTHSALLCTVAVSLPSRFHPCQDVVMASFAPSPVRTTLSSIVPYRVFYITLPPLCQGFMHGTSDSRIRRINPWPRGVTHKNVAPPGTSYSTACCPCSRRGYWYCHPVASIAALCPKEQHRTLSLSVRGCCPYIYWGSQSTSPS